MSSSLEVYGHPLSQPSRTVMIFCRLSEIPYKFRHIEFLTSRENMTDEYAKIHPFQEIPAIVHNNFNLWETGAIITYLADAFNIDNQWYPKDISIRAKINAYFHRHHLAVRAPIIYYTRAKVLFPKFFGGPELTKEKEAPHKKKMNSLLKSIDFDLKNHSFIARTEVPTIADIFLFSELASAFMLPIDLTPFSHVSKWFLSIKSIPIVAEIHQTLFEFLEAINPPKL